MQQWIDHKEALVTWAAVDRGALQVIASVLAVAMLALLLRRPLSSVLPWLLVLVLALGYEAAGGYADGLLQDWEIAGSIRDLALVMAVPTLLLLLCRFLPGLFHRPGRSAQRPPSPFLLPYTARAEEERIIDAEWEEIR